MSDPRVEEIRARLAAATPGPWDKDRPSAGRPFERVVVRNLGGGSQRSYVAECGSTEDWEFIANAPTDIALLLTKLDEAEKARDAARAEVERRPQRDFVSAVIADRNAAEERERTLIAGVREAMDILQNPLVNNRMVEESAAILSRLLPSTPTGET